MTVLILLPSFMLAASMQRKTVWDGVYSSKQAENGQYIYGSNCRRCHGGWLEGGSALPLQGKSFMEAWREDSVWSLYRFIKTSMPPRADGQLSDDETLSLVAFILQSNEMPAGDSDLHTAALQNVQIELRDGPRPLPSTALIQTVGCLTKDGDAWSLTSAGEPIRTRQSDKSTPEELTAAEVRMLGDQTFRLQNFAMLGSFKPELHAGAKVQTKGALFRQPAGDRISLTAMEVLSSSCGQ